MSISFRNIRDEGVRKVNSAAERLLIKSEGSIVLQLSDNTMWIYNNGTWAIIAGGLQYQGTWDASTNTPTLASGVGTQGQYYVVSVAGSTNLDGITSWATGDWAIFNGTTWQKIDNTNAYLPLTGGTLTGALNINGSANSVQLQVRANATQTANLTEWQNSGGSVLASVLPSGSVVICNGGSQIGTYQLTVVGSGSTSYIGLKPVGQSGFGFSFGVPSANNSEVWNYGTGYLRFATNNSEAMRIISTGEVGIGTFAPAKALHVSSATDASIRLERTGGSSAVFDITAGNSRFSINGPVFTILGSSLGINQQTPTANLHLNTSSASTVGHIIRGATSQTANLTEWQNSAGTVLAFVNSSGRGYFSSGGDGFGLGDTGSHNRLLTYSSGASIRLFNSTGSYASFGVGRIAVGPTYGALQPTSAGDAVFEGSVGVGTSSPSDARLQVVTSTAGAVVNSLVLQNPNSAGGTGVRLIMAATSAIAPNQNGRIDFVGTRMAGDDSMDLSIALSPGLNGTPLTRFYLDGSTGNVGIGTTSPQTSLHVVGKAIRGESSSTDATAKSFDIIQGHHTNAQAPFSLFTTISNATQNIVWIGGGSGSYNSATDVRIFTGASNTTLTGTERLRVTSTGNVGIGTTSPSELLHLSGSSTAQRSIRLDYNISNANGQFYIQGRAVGGGDALVIGSGNAISGSLSGITYMGATNRLGFGLGLTSAPQASVHFATQSASNVGLIVQGASAQTADIQQWQNSAGTVLSSIDVNGYLRAGSNGATLARVTSDRAQVIVRGSTDGGTAGPFIDYDINSSANAGVTFARLVNGTLSTATSGTNQAVAITPSFAPSAGSGNFWALNIGYTANASGAQTGTLIGLRVNRTQSGVNNFATDILADFLADGAGMARIYSNGNVG